MVAAVKWESASTKRTAIDLGTTLANDTMSAAGAVIDNSVNLDTYAWVELTTSDNTALFDTTAPNDANPTLDIYIVQAPNGTNYDEAPITGGTDQQQKFLIAIPLQKNTTAARIIVGPVLLPPHKFQLYADGQWGTGTLTAEWEVNLYTNNLESQ